MSKYRTPTAEQRQQLLKLLQDIGPAHVARGVASFITNAFDDTEPRERFAGVALKMARELRDYLGDDAE